MAEGFGAFLLCVGIGVILFFVFRHNWKQAQDLDNTYQSIARSHNGTCVPGGFWGRPVIKFPFAGSTAMVDIYTTGGKHPQYYTQMHLAWPDAHLRCEVYPERFVHGVGKMFGMADIQIGSPDFDPHYMICGNSEEAIRRLLNKDVQQAIDALRKMLGNNDIYVSTRGGRLLIKKHSLMRDERSLERFIQLACSLYDAASLTNSAGIDFVNPAQSEATLSLASAICQVCGDDIVADVVYCRSCKTPHHADCWEYYGSCSTYGCGQTRFLVARK